MMWILLLALTLDSSQADVGTIKQQTGFHGNNARDFNFNDFEQEILHNLRNYVDIQQNHVESIMPSVPLASFTIQHSVPFGRTQRSYQTPTATSQSFHQPMQYATARRDYSQDHTQSYAGPVGNVLQDIQAPLPYFTQNAKAENKMPERDLLREHLSRQLLDMTFTPQTASPARLDSAQAYNKPNPFTPLQNNVESEQENYQLPKREPARFYGPASSNFRIAPSNNLLPPVPQYSKNSVSLDYLPPKPVQKLTNSITEDKQTKFHLDNSAYEAPIPAAKEQTAFLPDTTNNGYLPPHMDQHNINKQQIQQQYAHSTNEQQQQNNFNLNKNDLNAKFAPQLNGQHAQYTQNYPAASIFPARTYENNNNKQEQVINTKEKEDTKAQEQLSKAHFIDTESGIDTKYASNGGYIY